MKRILILVDCQNDFCARHGALAGQPQIEAEARIEYLLSHKDLFSKIILTQDLHGENYLDTVEGKHLPVKHCIQGSWGAAIHPGILKGVNKSNALVSIIPKSTFMANPSHMEYELKDLETGDEVYVCGFCTDICVASNALLIKGITAGRDIEVYVLPDLCEGATPDGHEGALKVMQACQINLVSVNKILGNK